jgi:carbon-monoxide dehydrogenase small subunit
VNTPRPQGRVEAGQDVEVSFTVNGTPVTMNLPARVTLSDALRDRLGLTGTHVGCEHGVCGMCTILVDGEAARACLLFACQVDGADIVTVEGLGRPDDLHPLQEAFGRHHGLQCGFCTPGFLMSSYDLLSHEPGVRREDLPEQLSGVICRCTGYRGILDAVDDVARAHPDGIPGPGNCAARTLVGRGGGGSSATPTEAAPVEDELQAVPREITLPSGEPTIDVTVDSELTSSPEEVARVLADIPLLARCLPGAELTEDLGDGWYRGRAKVALGPIRLSFNGVAQVVEHEDDRIVLLAQGEDTGGGGAQARIELVVEPHGTGSQLRADARVFLVGRIAGFGRSLAGDVSRRMFEQFARAVDQTAAGAEPPALVEPPGAARLLAGSLADRFRRLLTRGRAALARRRSA